MVKNFMFTVSEKDKYDVFSRSTTFAYCGGIDRSESSYCDDDIRYLVRF